MGQAMNNQQMILTGAVLTDVHHKNKGGAIKTHLKVSAVLNVSEQKRLHALTNGYKSGQLDRVFKPSEMKLVPPVGLKHHQLAVSVDRAANFRIKKLAAEDGKPARQVLEFTCYCDGQHLEAVAFMGKLGEAACRCDLQEKQGELFEKTAAAKRPKLVNKGKKDAKQKAAGERDDDAADTVH